MIITPTNATRKDITVPRATKSRFPWYFFCCCVIIEPDPIHVHLVVQPADASRQRAQTTPGDTGAESDHEIIPHRLDQTFAVLPGQTRLCHRAIHILCFCRSGAEIPAAGRGNGPIRRDHRLRPSRSRIAVRPAGAPSTAPGKRRRRDHADRPLPRVCAARPSQKTRRGPHRHHGCRTPSADQGGKPDRLRPSQRSHSQGAWAIRH